jgi:hypothetical protein
MLCAEIDQHIGAVSEEWTVELDNVLGVESSRYVTRDYVLRPIIIER